MEALQRTRGNESQTSRGSGPIQHHQLALKRET